MWVGLLFRTSTGGHLGIEWVCARTRRTFCFESREGWKEAATDAKRVKLLAEGLASKHPSANFNVQFTLNLGISVTRSSSHLRSSISQELVFTFYFLGTVKMPDIDLIDHSPQHPVRILINTTLSKFLHPFLPYWSTHMSRIMSGAPIFDA